jgi:Leucine-rich repeat (LRR) protein
MEMKKEFSPERMGLHPSAQGGGGDGFNGKKRIPRLKMFQFPISSSILICILLGMTVSSINGNGEIESCVRLQHSSNGGGHQNPNSGLNPSAPFLNSGGGGVNNRLGDGNNVVGNGLSSSPSGGVGGNSDHSVILCQIRTLHPDLDVENLTSSLPSGPVDAGTVTKLKLVCNDVLFFESSVAPGQLSSLSDLHELSIEKCKLKHLPADFLSGLRHLRRLSVNTGNSDWAARSLEISPGALSSVPSLRHIHLGYNHMWNLPERLLCQVGSLQTLNLTHNLLSDIDDLGLPGSPLLVSGGRVLPLQNEYAPETAAASSSSSGRISSSSSGQQQQQSSSSDSCLGDLKSFDLSYNSLRTLGSRRLERLRRLTEFRVDHNWLEEVEDEAFTGLGALRLLNLSSNRLVALPAKLFQPCKLLTELDLHNNSLTALSPGLLNGLEHLQVLDLSMNSISSQWITAAAFTSLVRLVILRLSHNQLTHLAPESFRDLYSLQVLDLSNNLVSSIDDGTFAHMKNLHSLNLGRNRLVNINPNMLNGLYVLVNLILDYNQIQKIENGAFRNCTSLQDLGLLGNQLAEVPEALRGLQLLRSLDLGENRISSLNNDSFHGMIQLYGLRLVENQLEELPKGLCDPLPRLRAFNVAQNKIRKVSSSAFISCPELKVLRLDSNQLDMLPTSLAPQLPNLLWLNVSENRIRWADYSQLPTTLEWFGVSHNQLETLGGAWAKSGASSGSTSTTSSSNSNNRIQNQSQQQTSSQQNIRLRVVDASHNHLSQLDHHAVPASLEILRLSHNRLKRIAPDTFSRSSHLRRVELIGNQLENIPLNALRLPPFPVSRPLPEFFLGGNPFLCDCEMEWLTRINQLSALRQHPTVLDLDAIVCRLAYSRTVTHVSLPDIKTQDFLCPYKSHCFTTCHCCDFDACDCAMTCPSNCTCYHDDTWTANVVSCANTGHTDIPARLPMDSTQVYLDGNNIPTLKSHIFIGRKNLRILFLNSSRIETISNKSFNGLQSLQSLHLENNNLRTLHGYEFDHLLKLRELYLQDNLIETISNATFLPLKALEILRLDGNRLLVFTVWQLSLNPYLVEIGLARNQWNCDCQFLHQLYGWVTDNSRKVVDLTQMQCVWNTTHKPGPHLMDYNRTCGSSWALMGMDGGFDFTTISPLQLVLTILSLLILLIFVVILVICCRDNVRLWIFSQFGFRLCTSDFDDECLYDAYLMYSQKDEEFVAQKVSDELESNDSYRICLHYRDLISESGDLKDMMMGAVENSKSVVVLLSRNFLQGEWTSGEYRGAFHAVLKKYQKAKGSTSLSSSAPGHNKKVVLVLIDDINPVDVNPDIRSWVRHNRIQVIKWSVSSPDPQKHKKFWSKLKYSLPPPSSHYCSNITSNTTTTTATSASSTETQGGGGGGYMATLKYSTTNDSDHHQHQIIVDEMNRLNMSNNSKLWPYASNFVALPPKYTIPSSPNNSQGQNNALHHLHQNTYNNYTNNSPNHHPHYYAQHQNQPPQLPLSNPPPPKSPPSSQSTDSTTTNGGDETTVATPTSFQQLLMHQMHMHANNKSPVPVPKSSTTMYSSSNNHISASVGSSSSNSGGGGGCGASVSSNHGGGGVGESYLSLEGEHVYSTLDPPSPQPTQPHPNNIQGRMLNNIQLPNGYTYQPQQLTQSHHPQQQQQQQWHPSTLGGPHHHHHHLGTPKGTLTFGSSSKGYKTQKENGNGSNSVQTYLV